MPLSWPAFLSDFDVLRYSRKRTGYRYILRPSFHLPQYEVFATSIYFAGRAEARKTAFLIDKLGV
jgi:hypothetical protein